MSVEGVRRDYPGWWRWLRRTFIIAAIILIIASFLPLWNTDEWWVRELDYPRLQIFALLIAVTVILWAFNARWSKAEMLLGTGIVAALLWQGSHFLPFLPFWSTEVESVEQCAPDKRLSLLNINVLQTNDRYADVRALVTREDADVVLLLETDPGWEEHMAPLKALYPYGMSDPVPSTYGMMLFSKLPMQGEIHYRLQRLVPSMDATITMRSGDAIELKALHPEPPWPGEDTGERDAELVTAGREVRASGRAGIVMGDLNDVAWSQTSRLFRKVGGMRDPRVGRGLHPTFHASHIWMRWPLDHVFLTPHWALIDMARKDKIGSDHFPIRYDVCLTEDADKRLVAGRPDRETSEEALEQIEDGAEEARGQE